jgi:hypothetical protein
MQKIVTLPHISPLVMPTQQRMATLVHMPSTSSHGGEDDILEDIDLDEVILILRFDLKRLTLEKI